MKRIILLTILTVVPAAACLAAENPPAKPMIANNNFISNEILASTLGFGSTAGPVWPNEQVAQVSTSAQAGGWVSWRQVSTRGLQK